MTGAGNDLDRELWKHHERATYCTGCGRDLVVVTERTRRRDSVTGERIVETYKECPRFRRGWFNLWLGGWMHDSLDMANPMLERRWVWHKLRFGTA